MRYSTRRTLLIAAIAGASASVASAQSLSTIFAGGNSGSSLWTNYFDMTVENAMAIQSLDVHASAAAGTPFTITVYLTELGGTYSGNEFIPGAWTQVATGSGTSNGVGTPTPVNISDFLVTPGTYGVAIRFDGSGMNYTNGNGTNQTYSNADLTLNLGSSASTETGPFTAGLLFSPRVWNGTIFYDTSAVVEVPAMSVYSSKVDFDDLPTGPVTVAQINAAGSNGGAMFDTITTTPKAAAAGTYDTNTSFGQALAAQGGALNVISNNGSAPFDPVTYEFTFTAPQTEFGVGVGDWNGPMVLEFFNGATSIGTITSSGISSTEPVKFFKTSAAFNRVTLDVSSAAGNFVVHEVWTHGQPFPIANHAAFNFIPFGSAASSGPTDVVMHQVFASSLFGSNPVEIDSLWFAPNGALAGMTEDLGDIIIRLGYTQRQPGVAPPAGLDIPTAGGAPNASGPMANFFGQNNFMYTVARGGTNEFEMEFDGNNFTYNPSLGNLLVEIVANDTTNQTFGVSRSAGGAQSSRAFAGTAFGTATSPTTASRIGFEFTTGCYANCDGSTGSPVLNTADFGCFLTKFAAGLPYANCDGSTGSPQLNVADFGCFLAKFAAGCP